MTLELAPDANLSAHPLAEMLPSLGNDEYEALREHVRLHGLLEPIWLLDGKILDGRHRYRACLETGRAPSFRDANGAEPLAIVQANLTRRHLNTSQRAMIATRLEEKLAIAARERQGARTDITADRREGSGTAAAEAAKTMAVGERTVERAKKVRRADPDLAAKVEKGEVSLDAAAKTLKKREQAEQEKKAETSIARLREESPDFARADQQARDARLSKLLSSALSSCAPVRTALDRTLEMVGRLDRDELTHYAEQTRKHGDVLIAVAEECDKHLASALRRVK